MPRFKGDLDDGGAAGVGVCVGLSWLAIGVEAGKELVGATLTGAILAVWKK